MKLKRINYFAYGILIVSTIVCLACLDSVDVVITETPTDTTEETTETPTVTQPDPLPAGQGLAAGTTAPDFSLPDAGNNTVSLSDYAGQIVVIQFFSTST